MAEIKTKPTGDDVTAFLDAVADERRRGEGHALRELFERVTGEPATMWGRRSWDSAHTRTRTRPERTT